MKQEIEEDTEINIQEQMSLEGWSATKMPAQTGRLAVVTGATGGLGYETALGLARGCADVIIAGRNEAKGRGAADKIRSLAPKSLVRFEKLDLADLRSVSAFAARLAAAGRPVDMLINNAGVMALPVRELTVDSFEMQFGTNHLGHFALTAQLLPLLRVSKAPRVVQVSSLAYRVGKIRFEDIHSAHSYGPWESYAQSKLAGVLFAGELQRRSDENGWSLVSTAVHPGYARTDLVANGPGARSAIALVSRSLGRIVSQSAASGAQPALFAASSPGAQPGGFYGPGGLFGIAGAPVAALLSERGRDMDVARKLWHVSEEMTGVEWAVD
jgi:NAD(P)-dependent dehydrogenase (short-subunit alcohol dehydrogenase family)